MVAYESFDRILQILGGKGGMGDYLRGQLVTRRNPEVLSCIDQSAYSVKSSCRDLFLDNPDLIKLLLVGALCFVYFGPFVCDYLSSLSM